MIRSLAERMVAMLPMQISAVRAALEYRHYRRLCGVAGTARRHTLPGAHAVYPPAPTYLYTMRKSGWSRTQVDYRGTAAQTEALLRDPRIAGTPIRARCARANLNCNSVVG